MSQAREETTAEGAAASRWSALKERALDVGAAVLVVLFLVGTTLAPRGLHPDVDVVDTLALRGAALVKDVVQHAQRVLPGAAEAQPGVDAELPAVPGAEVFTRLEVEGPVTVVVREGGPRLMVLGSPGAVRVEEADGVLRLVRAGPGVARVEVSTVGLRDVRASGGSCVTLEGVESDALGVQAARGASVVATDLRVNTVQVMAAGGARVQLGGEAAERLLVHARSGSRVEADDLEAELLQVSATGAAQVKGHATERVDARVASASTLSVRGSPEVRDVKVGTTSTLAWF